MMSRFVYKNIVICIVFSIALFSCIRNNNLKEETCVELALCIPDHTMDMQARSFFTEDYLVAWDAINALPDASEYAGYLPDKEWIYYLVTGNGGCDELQVHIANIKQQDSTAIFEFAYVCTSGDWYKQHTISATFKDGKWLIDEYDDSKQRMKDWVQKAKISYKNDSTLYSFFEDSISYYNYRQDMEHFMSVY